MIQAPFTCLVVLVSLVLMVQACTTKLTPPPESSSEPPKAVVDSRRVAVRQTLKPPTSQQSVEPRPQRKEPTRFPKDIKYNEQVFNDPQVRTTTWVDQKGVNRFEIISRRTPTEDLSLAVEMTHAIKQQDGTFKTVRVFKERLKRCKDSVAVSRIHQPDITDLDGNGVAEITWAYSVGCRHKQRDYVLDSLEDEVGERVKGVEVKGWLQLEGPTKPLTHKVLMTEFGAKYAIRGTTVVLTPKNALKAMGHCGGDMKTHGGQMRVDPVFTQAPARFKVHAKKLWTSTVNERIRCEHITPG